MKIRDYLALKYQVRTPTTMTYPEAKVFGIPWPLPHGWLKTYGGFDISRETSERLIAANEDRRRKTKSARAEKYASQGRNAAETSQRTAQWKPKVDVTRSDFLQTYEWRRVRMSALQLYGSRCQCCGATPADGAKMHVDHIKPRALFPDLALDVTNLQVLCHECNHGKGNWDMTDWREQQHVRSILSEDD